MIFSIHVQSELTLCVRWHQIAPKQCRKNTHGSTNSSTRAMLRWFEQGTFPFITNSTFYRHAKLLDFFEIDSALIMSLRLSHLNVPHHPNRLHHRVIYFCIDGADWRWILSKQTAIRFPSWHNISQYMKPGNTSETPTDHISTRTHQRVTFRLLSSVLCITVFFTEHLRRVNWLSRHASACERRSTIERCDAIKTKMNWMIHCNSTPVPPSEWSHTR